MVNTKSTHHRNLSEQQTCCGWLSFVAFGMMLLWVFSCVYWRVKWSVVRRFDLLLRWRRCVPVRFLLRFQGIPSLPRFCGNTDDIGIPQKGWDDEGWEVSNSAWESICQMNVDLQNIWRDTVSKCTHRLLKEDNNLEFIPKLLLRCGLFAWTLFRLILKKAGALSGL